MTAVMSVRGREQRLEPAHGHQAGYMLGAKPRQQAIATSSASSPARSRPRHVLLLFGLRDLIRRPGSR